MFPCVACQKTGASYLGGFCTACDPSGAEAIYRERDATARRAEVKRAEREADVTEARRLACDVIRSRPASANVERLARLALALLPDDGMPHVGAEVSCRVCHPQHGGSCRRWAPNYRHPSV